MTNGTVAWSDPWDVGELYSKPALWAFYSLTNYTGAVFCGLLVYSICRSHRRIAMDVFVGLECIGCFFMSIPCATQCAINWASGTDRFQRGERACWWEAFCHVSAIMIQFFALAMMAAQSFRSMIWRKDLSVKHALYIALGIWIVCELATLGFMYISPVILMPAGLYCFPAMNSILIFAWFVPAMLLALGLMIYCYTRIFLFVRATERAVLSSTAPAMTKQQRTRQSKARRMAWQSGTFELTFFGGWSPAAVGCIFALSTGYLTEALDTAIGVCGSLHSLAVGFVYGWYNERFWRFMFRCGCCRCLCPRWKLRKVGNRVTVADKSIASSDSPETDKDKRTLSVPGSNESPHRGGSVNDSPSPLHRPNAPIRGKRASQGRYQVPMSPAIRPMTTNSSTSSDEGSPSTPERTTKGKPPYSSPSTETRQLERLILNETV